MINKKQSSPIFIISSARSGSKLLRDLLISSGELSCYPYDVNYVWKYGNFNINHDELTLDDLNSRKRAYIRKYFNNIEKDGIRLLEKTVSNSLRLDFVKAIFPDARIVHLVRDGREVTASLKQCWTEPSFTSRNQSLGSLIRKIINFPWFSSSSYLKDYIRNNASFIVNGGQLRSWGPRFEGIDEMLAKSSLIEVCASQWSRSVSCTLDYFRRFPQTDNTFIRYEDLVARPREVLMNANQFLCLNNIEKVCRSAEESVSVNKKSSWLTVLNDEERALALPILANCQSILGYE